MPSPAPPPLGLYRVHRVLICAGVFCCTVTSYYGVRSYMHGQGSGMLVLSAVGLVAAIGLLLYLRYFNAKIARR
jgi:hypothetical protein